MRTITYTDHLEKAIGEHLDIYGIEFIHESEGADLDFYLPQYDVYIEVKQFHADRISKQTSRHDNVIVIQGMKSLRLFLVLLSH